MYDCRKRVSNPTYAIKVLLIWFGVIDGTNIHGLTTEHNYNGFNDFPIFIDSFEQIFILALLSFYVYFALIRYIW